MSLLGATESHELIFFVNEKKISVKNADPETTLLSYLRKKHILFFICLTGTKYGCGVGGCGACTVMISIYNPFSKKILRYSANACLIPICSLHGAAVTTVEGVGSTKSHIHPVQERIAKWHGSQCGFCTPGMVMSIYTLLQNYSEPSSEQIYEALVGNLCRCTGYRPIIEGCKTFCKTKDFSCCKIKEKGNCCMDIEETLSSCKQNEISQKLFTTEEFQPQDPTQKHFFPPELVLMATAQQKRTLSFRGERTTWISPSSLKELLELKSKFPKAPLVVGNTIVGTELVFKGAFHPVIISPTRIFDLNTVIFSKTGLTLGATCSLSLMKDILTNIVSELPREKVGIFHALLQQLKCLGGRQIRNMACLGGNIISRQTSSDLNPVLAAGCSVLNVASKRGSRQIPLDEDFLTGSENTSLAADEILVSVYIPYSKMGEFVSAFRQAQRRENALPIVNAGMRVSFKSGSDIIADISIYFGGIASTTICAKKSCQMLKGRAWNEHTLEEACRLVSKEISILPPTPEGMTEYKQTLAISFIFKFYFQIVQQFNYMHSFGHQAVPMNHMSILKTFDTTLPQGSQKYQDVDPAQLPHDTIGCPLMHHAGVKHATGEAIYCDDMHTVENELFLALVTSSRAHAKIVSIDVSETLQLPGVIDVITVKDVPGRNEFCCISEPESLFVTDKVTCVGQIICAVIADSATHAKRATSTVKIIYKDLEPVVLTIEEATEHKSFFSPERKLEQGNVQKGFLGAEHILEGEIHIGGQEHFYMETQSVLVVPKGEDKEIDIYVSSQHPSFTQELVASVLNIPYNRIRCHVKRVGGGFGGKVTKPAILAAITAVAANKTGHAVRCVLDRGDDMLITGGRHPFFGRYKVGFMNDGTIVALDVRYYSNAGCTPDESVTVMENALLRMDNAYKIPNLLCQGCVCRTNLPSNTAFRGFGFPQSALVTETLITDIATKTGLPPEKIREKNMYKTLDRTHYKQEVNPKNLIRCWNECMKKSCFYKRKEDVEKFNKYNYWKKKGIAIIPLKYSIGFEPKFLNQAAALVHIYLDGHVLVTHGGVELGQGIHTKIMQIASRELKIPMSYIYISETSTVTVPNTRPTAASIGTDINGMAVKNACETLMKRLQPIMDENPEGKWKDWITEAFHQSIGLSATGFFRGYDTHMDWEKGEGHPFEYFVFGAACSEVEIDCLTGDHKNIRTDIVMDVGCSINPAIDIGQIEGAFVQGLGLYTMEVLKFSPEGVLRTCGPNQYKIPAICDIPEQFSVSLLSSSQNISAIYSSKAIGEPALFLGCSVFFAIKDAISAARKERGLTGLFTLHSPATPEHIRMACVDQFTMRSSKNKSDVLSAATSS
ncbi:aldehyde oxidase-like [Anolis carolinensis]|uniref:aldehyde oxidase n=1 Tax=Anolis carolinensis TaxID=28377 RepID=M1ZMR2_ANOCA|nr:aldehyde oxidase-like [Anolis carolinensis]DAA64415.1 TPA_inf: aldehyde oxidase delta [Anolis carolinensis]|eukprot:NP_001280175.1 aldehyde oxidase-like [Anolis carolinensis]